ncbi:MT-A70 family methyltransferase [Corynebacterium flavescens]|uniref:MT-A70 family methyltransferase n=1 Tax=Corynebacterium flavescens TaxID=28028 RepID=UPI003FCFDCE6
MTINTNHQGSAASAPPPTPAAGTYTAIYADPPWVPSQKGKYGASQHYELMTTDRICAMGEGIREIAADNSFCFLWVTNATVPDGLRVLEAWGFRYTSFYFWAKPRFTLGNTFRNAGELLLLGVRGKGTKVAFRSQPNWGFHPLQEHSHKPEEVHHIVERLAGEGRFLELFARREAPSRAHWDVWGNEVDATISLARWGFEVPSDQLEVRSQTGDQS